MCFDNILHQGDQAGMFTNGWEHGECKGWKARRNRRYLRRNILVDMRPTGHKHQQYL